MEFVGFSNGGQTTLATAGRKFHLCASIITDYSQFIKRILARIKGFYFLSGISIAISCLQVRCDVVLIDKSILVGV